MFFFAGPNFNYALKKVTNTENYADNKLHSKTDKPNIYDSEDYNPFDVQLGAGMGIQFKMVSLRLGYNWGLLNRTNIDKVTFKENDIKISLGVTF